MSNIARLAERRESPSSDATLPRDKDRPLDVCVVYATYGRPDVLSRTFEAVARQTVRPSSIIVSCTKVADAGTLAGRHDVTVLVGPKGSARQRNRALAALPPSTDVVVFFDDDFVPHPHWIEEVVGIFRTRAVVGAATGHLLADGIKGPGLSLEAAFAAVEGAPAGPTWIAQPYSPYGCNMAFRRRMIEGLRFDERLVLYGWLEDRDFGAALARRGGQTVKVGAALGVHMGVKRGRVRGVQLGYSQVVNPIYLNRKGTMRIGLVIEHIFRNVASNVAKALRPEPYVDRAGRLRGNLTGLFDLLRGRITPERAEAL